jgi:hypothetical protein
MGKEVKLANDHAEYVATLVRAVYEAAFIHGFKHGQEAMQREE